VFLNGHKAKPASKVEVGHIIEVDIPRSYTKLRVISLPVRNLKKSEAGSLYETLEFRRKELI